LPPFARLETVQSDGRSTQWLVEPFGYAAEVAGKLIETLEIALWGAIIAVAIGLPVAVAGASNLTHRRATRAAARGLIALLRAVPELVSVLFLVAAYGFGPLAGVLALGLHGAGFLGKFYADEMENADPAPQEALAALGLPRLIVWRHAILPQVMPQFAAFTLYILDRNVRMATVVGLVGAGGIGQELKGRFDMYQYDRVGTILLGIVAVVLAIDVVASRLRRQMLHG
jgi:phosphonate transport system permease protein